VQRNGATLIVAILGARDQWGDTKRLLEYGFDHYDMLKAHPQGDKAAANEQQVGVRSDRLSALMVKPQESNPPRSGEGFVLQVGAFRERDRAEALSRQIAEKGFDVFVEQASINHSEASYRVRLGPYPDLIAAHESAQRIYTASGHRALIMPLPTTGQEGGDPG
ncbi:MAG: SPOR domain-containing protein, partial [Candidatus Binatia bacterium]